MKKGIDISQWQGNVDFDAVKRAGYEFVMIRAGYGRYLSQKDPDFEQNYAKAKAAGLGVGAYWYSYAMTPDYARQEADICMQALEGKQFDYPIAFDIEESKQAQLPNIMVGDIVKAFCERMENRNYYVSLYSYASFLSEKVPAEYRKKYDVWVAAFDVSQPSYSGAYGMWQYTARGKVSGVNGDCDCDYAYKDYPSIIKSAGLNGYNKTKDDSPKANVKGDLNGDGKVDVTDLSMLAAHVKGKKPLK